MVTGEPFLVSTSGTNPSLSRDGSLLYRGGKSSMFRSLVWVDREGDVVGALGEPLRDPRCPRLSPDGRWVVVSAYEDAQRNLWLVDVERGTRRQLTFEEGPDTDPAWQGSRRVLFTRHGVSLRACAVSIDSNEIELLSGMRGGVATGDGRYRVFHERGEIWLDDGEGEPELFHTSGSAQKWPVISPGRGVRRLRVRGHRAGRTDSQALSFRDRAVADPLGGGTWPRWSRAGDELFFSNEGYLYVMGIETGDEVSFDAPRRLFGEREQGVICGLGYDLDLTGERILCLRSEEVARSSITLVQSWYAEFEPR